ncbi:TetR/AcrR family transcriptional regulator [Bacillus cytotoxicus]|uniref:Transcriptional regulator, TetR family n=1 Tax=Bacillus cytotoxicus TaxID=580165 RepID=A0AAX2CGS7_9BACI|nr:TetR/AcrR family transcriptional regulator [Bacillus cytotoxicus]QTR82590.1 TetR/AcrR family transcriptional regulator [Bacillus cytotoxicus]QTR86328.1 TetR/AcrR family transcriptional regulator [Bacillus cytotoxicus]SCL89467.1 Transcriptional regulator, TetR family [Bacillus cytotoxicus]
MTKNEMKKSEMKKTLILESAKKVFMRKGYSNVTMHDIVKESGISRGGLYYYYQSVEEIFHNLIAYVQRTDENSLLPLNSSSYSFIEIFDVFLNEQKKELLGQVQSLRPVIYEYYLSLEHIERRHKLKKHYEYVYTYLNQFLSQNVRKSSQEIDQLTNHIIIILEGLFIQSLTTTLTEAQINYEFKNLRALIFNKKKA